MQNLIEIYSTIVELPVEYQVILGIGALVVLAALRNVWGILFPLRWAVASLFRVVAYLLHPRKRRRRLAPSLDVTKNPDSFMDGLGTRRGFIKAAKYYSKPKRVKDLDDKQLDLLLDIASAYNLIDNYDTPNYIKNLRFEINRRQDQRRTNEKLERILNPQPEPDEFTRREIALKKAEELAMLTTPGSPLPPPPDRVRTEISTDQVL